MNTRLSASSIQLNRTQSDGLSSICSGSETELNRTQFNGLSSIGSGKPIKSKPKASPSKQVFLVLFYNLFTNGNPIYKLSTAVKRREQNRTEQSYHYSRGRIPKLFGETVSIVPWKGYNYASLPHAFLYIQWFGSAC